MADTGYPAYSRYEFVGIDLTAAGGWFLDGPAPSYWVVGFGICHLRGRIGVTGSNGPPDTLGVVPLPAPSTSDVRPESFLAPAYGISGAPAGVGVIEIVALTSDSAALVYAAGPTDPTSYSVEISGITYPAT